VAVDELLADARVDVVTALENIAISRTKIAFARHFVTNNTVKQVSPDGPRRPLDDLDGRCSPRRGPPRR
jgi:hypothetical protein